MSTTFHGSGPAHPLLGDVYMDGSTYYSYVWMGNSWAPFSADSDMAQSNFTEPSKDQLEKHPALKASWEEFLVIKKLLGV